MDLQYVADAYSTINNVYFYVLKADSGMSVFLKQVGKQLNDKGVKKKIKNKASTFTHKCKFVIHESVMRVMSNWPFGK